MVTKIRFTVETEGKGNPDYNQSVEAPSVERALVVSFPEIQVAAKRFDDFAQLSVTAIEQNYVIGTNANARIAGSWEDGQLAREIQFYATNACWVRFNSPAAIPQFIPASLPLRFYRRVLKFYYYQDAAPGTLYCWIEG